MTSTRGAKQSLLYNVGRIIVGTLSERVLWVLWAALNTEDCIAAEVTAFCPHSQGSTCDTMKVHKHAVGQAAKPYLLLTAGETSTERVSSYTATLASDKTRALLAMQTAVPGLFANVVHEATEIL